VLQPGRTLILILGIVAGVALAGQSREPVSAATAQYTQDKAWAPVPEAADPSWEMNGITTNAAGRRVFASKRTDPPILEIDPETGKILKTWGAGLMRWPHSIYLDPEGFLWIVDAGIGSAPELKLNKPIESGVKAGKGHQVTKLTADGKVVMTLGTAGVAGLGPNVFNAPTGVVVAPGGEIFVSDGHGGDTNARVVKFSKDGKFVKDWGKKGAAPGEFNAPHAIAMDSRGRILVADRSNSRIQVFDPDGKFVAEWKQFGAPSGIAVMPDDTMFVTSSRKITIGNAKDGTVLGLIEDVDAEGITADGRGHVYASEVFKRSLKKFTRR
jgi:DNA-binding beta-propeller fold protein YncE